ncbi:MAG: ankyrin-like [Gammaproteobacteria bacterium]|jgi:ankyrin repeat protein|nr:ankyrin-like [Gammaproteobacteria bacterium]
MFSSLQSPKAFPQLMTIIQKDSQDTQSEKDIQIAASLIDSDKSCLTQIDSVNDWQLLHFAVLSDHPLAIELVKLLCEAGANINARARTGETPLHLAVLKNKVTCVRYLLAKGADFSLPDCDGQTAKKIAEKNGICKEEFTQVPDFHLEAPPKSKAPFGSLAVAGPAQASNMNSSELQAFCLKLMSLDLLQAKGYLEQAHCRYYVNLTDEKGWTLLHHAASLNPDIYGSKLGFLNLLCMLGAEVNALTALGESPLHLAGRSGNAEYIEFLLQQNADYLLKDADGRTALHLAILTGHEHCAGLLLNEMRCNLHRVIDENKKTLLHFSVEASNPYSLKALYLALTLIGSQDAIYQMVNFKDAYGKTALHYAAETGQVECIKILLAIGADINAKSDLGNTPLHSAAYCGASKEGKEAIRLLIAAGANSMLENQFGQTWKEMITPEFADSASSLTERDAILMARYRRVGDPCPNEAIIFDSRPVSGVEESLDMKSDTPLLLQPVNSPCADTVTKHLDGLASAESESNTPLLLIPVDGQRVLTHFFGGKQSPSVAEAAAKAVVVSEDAIQDETIMQAYPG